MSHNGVRAIRFHKRYYIFSSEEKPRPDHLGLQITKEIPADAARYHQWLAAQRKFAEKWEALYEDFLSVKPDNEVTNNLLPKFMRVQLPSFFAPLNEAHLKWIYTMDLDREVFSVNNKHHFKLEQVPHIEWIDVVCGESLVDQVSTDPVPWGGVTDFVIEHTDQSGELSLKNLTMGDTAVDGKQMVVAKDIKDIPWRQRYGPILRAIIFEFWSCVNATSLAATFLQLEPHDLPFREMAYTVLCLAAGGKNINLLPCHNVYYNDAIGFIHEGQEDSDEEQKEFEASEFVSMLASGAHLQGSSPGTSPEGTIYWLDNILVVLTAQLYRPGAVDEGIARIALYCQKHGSTQYVDAVLISVEHVVLVHIDPGGKIQHTAMMPLLDRYANAKSYEERLDARCENIMKKRMKSLKRYYREKELRIGAIDRNQAMNSVEEVESDEEDESALYMTQVDGNVKSTFYALVHLFEAAACKTMPVAKLTVERLPYEIYSQVIMQVTDMETRESLMKASRTSRRICQENLLFGEGLMFKPSIACQSCDEATRIPDWFERYDTDTGILSQADILELRLWGSSPIELQRTPGSISEGGLVWQVVIGTERNKRSLLAPVAIQLID